MKIRRGYNGGIFFVFNSESDAEPWEIFFVTILRMRWHHFGVIYNAFSWSK